MRGAAIHTLVEHCLAAIVLAGAAGAFVWEHLDPVASTMATPFSLVLMLSGIALLWNASTGRRVRALESKVNDLEARSHSPRA